MAIPTIPPDWPRCALKRCGKHLPSDRFRRHAKYCTKVCARIANHEAWRSLNPYPSLPTGTTGTISELLVAVDLLRKGYAVFRAITPNCPSDLAVLKDGKLLCLEVRTGYRNQDGSVKCTGQDDHRGDVLAIVIGPMWEKHSVHYIPPLP